jgi:hypothetical protein
MNLTKQEPSVALAGALFDEVLVPLAKQRRTAGSKPFFPLGAESSAASYFAAPTLAVMKPADFELPLGSKSEALINTLAALWQRQGETGLAAMAPRLKALAEALSGEAAENDGKVDILCYTLF